MFLECLSNILVLGLNSILINKFLKKYYSSYNTLKATNYLIASSVQIYILLTYMFQQKITTNTTSKNTSITITNIMFSYFIWDIIYVNFVCTELNSKILLGHHIVSGLLVWIGTTYGENFTYIIDICVASEVSNAWDNILFFLTTLNIIDERYKMYYVIRVAYLIHFGYDRLYNLPMTIVAFIMVGNSYEVFAGYILAVIIIPFSVRLFLIKTKSLIKKSKKID